MQEILLKQSVVAKIGLCYRGRDQDSEYACLVLDDGIKIVSTISLVTREGLTVGEYFQGRIDDYNYCIRKKDLRELKTEFELFDESIHHINKTSTKGYNGDHFEKVN